MIWIRRIALSLVGSLLVVIVLLIGAIAFDAAFGSSTTDYTNVEYTSADGTTLHGYLARPEADGDYPAVLMVHEWWGLNGEITELADRLAEEGYIVLAPDTYRGEVTAMVPRALILRLSVPEEHIEADMQAAYEYLMALDGVADRVGVIGFCYGGGVALDYATQNPAIMATINLYGDTILNADDFGELLGADAGAVLGIFGGADQMIPLDEVNAFEDALAAANINHTVTIYDGAGHAFVQPSTIDDEGAASEAWMQIINFFDEHLSSQ